MECKIQEDVIIFFSFTVTLPAKVIQLETDMDMDTEVVEDIGEQIC